MGKNTPERKDYIMGQLGGDGGGVRTQTREFALVA
jgi:hypothetical protein